VRLRLRLRLKEEARAERLDARRALELGQLDYQRRATQRIECLWGGGGDGATLTGRKGTAGGVASHLGLWRSRWCRSFDAELSSADALLCVLAVDLNSTTMSPFR
jgi:hypothetical protein